ncbi:SDA1 homolog isoform X1 [Olea europaea subsp. europaea]|uniref:Protein SDA1 n=1 Tax=Olea europaea subsp. europaea TaxID=158383 RepID=A0A8S0PMX3_OLEEU|nr:SDA1 homolog isoform X1 [Olea europaea subsp. europaea]
MSASGRASENLSLLVLQSEVKFDLEGYTSELVLIYNQFKSSLGLFEQVLRQLAFLHVIHGIMWINQKHKNDPKNRALQNILFGMLQRKDEAIAKRALITLCDFHWRKVWFDDRTANAICVACFHVSSK